MEEQLVTLTTQAIDGNPKKRDVLITILKDQSLSENQFTIIFTTLKGKLQSLVKHHEVLITYFLTCKWDFNDESAYLFGDLVQDLVSSKAIYLKTIIRSLVSQFLLKACVDDDCLILLKRKFNYIHKLIETITTIAPLSRKFISDAIDSFFPYIGKSLFILEIYTCNVLQMTTYLEDIKCQILAIVIDKMLTIDVQVPRQTERTQEEHNLQFDMEEEEDTKSVSLEVEKMDQLMCVLYNYVESFCLVDSAFSLKKSKSLFKDLLFVFENVVLKTQQSSHVQFVIYHAACLDNSLAVDFVEVCWNVFQKPSNALIIRQGASSYLGSFLARAKILDKEFITKQLTLMATWLHRYLKFQDGSNIHADYHKHGAFYSLCQTFFYTFVYHHQTFVDSRNGLKFLKTLDFPRVVLSKLNPLRFCLKSVVDMFARITRMYELVFCYSTIEKNNRHKLFSLQQDMENDKLQGMEHYFPFDPYTLPKSSRYIKPLYHEWHGMNLEDESATSCDDEDELLKNDMDEIDDLFDSIDPHVGLSKLSSSRKSAHSFDMMCVSPGFSLQKHI